MTKKTTGWEARLISYIRENGNKKFRPGVIDCGLFFGEGAEAMTGENITEPFKGKYRTIEDAIKIANDLGYENHVEYVASLFPELASPLLAQRGDCAVVNDMNGAPALGIVQGARIYVLTLDGLSLIPLTKATRAFRV